MFLSFNLFSQSCRAQNLIPTLHLINYSTISDKTGGNTVLCISSYTPEPQSMFTERITKVCNDVQGIWTDSWFLMQTNREYNQTDFRSSNPTGTATEDAHSGWRGQCTRKESSGYKDLCGNAEERQERELLCQGAVLMFPCPRAENKAFTQTLSECKEPA